MSPAVRSVPVESNGREDFGDPPDDVDARGVAMALIALRGDLGKRYGILATHVQDLHDVTKTLTDATSVLSSSVNRLSVRLDKAEEHDGRILAVLARLEGRGSQHEINDAQQDEQIATAKQAAADAIAKAERAALAARVRLGTVVTVIVLTLVALGTAGPERVAPLLNLLHSVFH